MQALTSGQINSNNKKSKKYQKYRTIEKKEDSTVCESNSVNLVVKKERTEDFLQKMNLQDFPELKSRKLNTKLDLDSFKEPKMIKSWALAVSKGNNQTVKQGFPVLPNFENIRKENVNKNVEKNDSTNLVPENKKSASTKINIKVVADKSVNKNVCSKKKDADAFKKNPVQPKRNDVKKKKTDPVLINFQDILAINKSLRRPKHHCIFRNQVQGYKNKELLSGNALDSSNPKRSRGKHREIKKKKLSKFKTTILKERILKHKIREATANGYLDHESLNKISEGDFKAEIKTYLSKLSERKLKNLEPGQNKISQKSNVEIIEKEIQKKNNIQVVPKNENPNLIQRKQIPEIGPDNKIRFSSKFREYCDNIITPELNTSVTELIKGVIELQDRLFLRDPIKAKAKKRHVTGIREVRKYLNLKKVKMLVIAPNLEKLQLEGSVYDSIHELKSMADAQNVSYVFALDRYKLGKYTKKNVPVSAFAILNYEGLEVLYGHAIHQLLEAKRRFSELSSPQKIAENTGKLNDVTSELLSQLVSAFHESLKVSSQD